MTDTMLTSDVKVASSVITQKLLLDHISALASDEFAGRCPGTEGEERTLKYFESVFRQIEEQTGVTFRTKRQEVRAIEIKSEPALELVFSNEKRKLTLLDEFVATSGKLQEEVNITNSDVIFVGYGIVAPEYDWDDFKDLDVKGKTILVLSGDPILKRSDDPTQVDTTLFRGEELTYYGRWTYKYELAGLRKAAAVFIIHEKERAGYGWDVVRQSFGRNHFELATIDPDTKPTMEGWLSLEAAKELFDKAGMSFETLKKNAQSRDFQPVNLGVAANARVTASFDDVKTYNFIGILDGADIALKKECILYSAHWDHFGLSEKGVLSGAIDNASGVASVLALAKAFASTKEKPKRSIVFFLPTLEEQNLLGSKYYADYPEFAMSDTLAVLNLEMMNVWGKSKAVSNVCQGHTSLDDYFAEAATRQQRTVVSEPESEKGYLYRSDHLPFMQKGVPALALFFPCMDFMDNRRRYIVEDYHKVTDKPKPDWDLSGAVQDTLLFFDIGWHLLVTGFRANWTALSEFRR